MKCRPWEKFNVCVVNNPRALHLPAGTSAQQTRATMSTLPNNQPNIPITPQPIPRILRESRLTYIPPNPHSRQQEPPWLVTFLKRAGLTSPHSPSNSNPKLQPSYSILAFTGDNISNDQTSGTSCAMHTYHGEVRLALHARTRLGMLTPSLAAHVWNDEIARNRRDRTIFQMGGSGI